jgi:L-rhamnose mutarotase
MKYVLRCGIACLAVAALVVFAAAARQQPKPVKRVGMVVGIKADKIDEYKKLHAAGNPGVRDLLVKYHMHNFNIFLQKMPDGKWYEFGYYEYTGDDFEGDMARLAKEPRNIKWLSVCDPMQVPLPDAKGWTEMEQVYFNP